MCGKECNRRLFIRANANLGSVASILGRQHIFLLRSVEVALGPAVVAALFDLHHDLGREFSALLRRVEVRPVLRELIPAVLRREQSSGTVEREPFAIADASRIAFRGREMLVGLVGVVPPDPGARLELSARLVARRALHAVRDLAGIGG